MHLEYKDDNVRDTAFHCAAADVIYCNATKSPALEAFMNFVSILATLMVLCNTHGTRHIERILANTGIHDNIMDFLNCFPYRMVSGPSQPLGLQIDTNQRTVLIRDP